jgi:hypothetical protein
MRLDGESWFSVLAEAKKTFLPHRLPETGQQIGR